MGSFAWSPDSTRLALIADGCLTPMRTRIRDKEKDKDKAPKPIVVKRLQFKEDGTGFLTEVREPPARFRRGVEEDERPIDVRRI